MEPRQSLEGRRVFVVEDDYLVAEVLCGLLEEAGAVIVGPIGQVDAALAFIEQSSDSCDCAILDVDLHGQKSYAIADALLSRNIRFAFATGYGSGALDSAYRRYPRCQKPFELRTLIAVLT